MDEWKKVFGWLRGGKSIRAEWDAGGDETIVSISVDGTKLSWNDPSSLWLSDLIADELELPNAGEWFVQGGGTVRLNGEKLEIEHSSTGSGMGWNPETDEEYFVEDELLARTDVLYEA